MKKTVGEVFSMAKANITIQGCTISEAVQEGNNSITYFTMAPDTDISAEIFPYHKMILVAEGSLEIYGTEGYQKVINCGESMLTEVDKPIGMRTSEGAVYIELSVRKGDIMNKLIKAGEVFKLEELVPYQEGKIVNMDIVHNEKMKFVVMSFDKGTGLSEHAAPGEALITALDGEAIIGYEGREHSIKAGESFRFAKGGLHFVNAGKRFKMALLLTME
ncbi:MAG: cupin [Hornefia sp.]|nr:cupin [Hornefia sp.]